MAYKFPIKNLAVLFIILFGLVSPIEAKDNDCIRIGNPNTDNSAIMCEKLPMEPDGIVRLSKIEVYPEYREEYLRYAVEVGAVSLKTEPGVLAMYAMANKDSPCVITILEIYSSQDAYRKHIASEHFQKYKQGTLHMVKTLELCDQQPLNGKSVIKNIIEE